jgi:hypothetical protein
MFSTCIDALASQGKLIIIGMMSQYASGWAPSSYPGLTGGGTPAVASLACDESVTQLAERLSPTTAVVARRRCSTSW